LFVEVGDDGKLHLFNAQERRIVNPNNYNVEEKTLSFVSGSIVRTSDAKKVGMSVSAVMVALIAIVFAL
jgi:hypothetical protein